MGLDRAKSLLTVTEGNTFLDLRLGSEALWRCAAWSEPEHGGKGEAFCWGANRTWRV